MSDQNKSRQELIDEIQELREELSRLKKIVKKDYAIDPRAGEANWDHAKVLRGILDNAQPIIFLLDQAGKFLISEGKSLSVLGFEPGQVVGTSALELYRDFPAIIDGINDALAGNYTRDEIMLGELAFDVFFSPYQDETGTVLGVLGMAVDVTEKVNSSERLGRLFQILEQATEGIIYTDNNFKISYINQATVDLYGWESDELIGKQPDIFNAEPLKEEYQAEIYETVTAGDIFSGQALNVRKDGSTFDCEMRICAITDSEGETTGYMSLVRDVTASNEAEKNLKRKLSETTILHEIAEAGARITDENEFINTVTQLVNETFYTDHVGILLVDEETDTLYPHSSYIGLKPKDFEERIPVGEGISGRVVQSGEPMIVPDVSAYDDYIPATPAMQSEICAPLSVGGKVIGVINVESGILDAFSEDDIQFLTTIAGQLATGIERTRLYRELVHSNLELSAAYNRTLEGWARALELRDHETQGHTERVTQLAMSMARAAGVDEDGLAHIRRGALLHDIGKIGIPDAILFKPGPLNERETAIMQRHTIFARDLLSRIPFLKLALDIPYLHHEKWDGTGYPLGLKGDQIPLAARIFAIVDVWDALISSRPYRPAWSKADTLAYILENAGNHFDPDLVPIFQRVLDEEDLL